LTNAISEVIISHSKAAYTKRFKAEKKKKKEEAQMLQSTQWSKC